MPTVRIPESVSNIPVKAKSAIRRGFEQFGRLDQSQKKYCYDVAPRILSSPSQVEPTKIAEKLSLKEIDAEDLIAALSFTTVLIATSSESVEHLIRVALEARVLDLSDQLAGTELIQGLLGERELLGKAVKVSQLAQEVLPSLLGFHSAVDLRASFLEDRVAYTVPTIIATLRVDAGVAREITFQLTQDEAISVRDRLSKEIHRAELLTKWAERKSSGPSTDSSPGQD